MAPVIDDADEGATDGTYGEIHACERQLPDCTSSARSHLRRGVAEDVRLDLRRRERLVFEAPFTRKGWPGALTDEIVARARPKRGGDQLGSRGPRNA